MSKPRLVATLNRVDNLEQRPFTFTKHTRREEPQLEMLPGVELGEEKEDAEEDKEGDGDTGRGGGK